ncbi:MAG TPA: oxidoreductase [Propionibacteriaceae bacterium]
MRETLVVLDPLADLVRFEGVASAVTAATDAVDAVLRDRGLRSVNEEQLSRALLAGATANAAMTDDPKRWQVGALRLSAELAPLAALIRVAPAQALARAHALVARGVVPDSDLGKIGSPSEKSQPEMAARMKSLGELLTRHTSASAIVVGAVAHAEIAVVAPFADASGLIARATEHLVLIAAGVDPYGVIVVEAGHAERETSYASELAAYAEGSVAGVRGWLLRCAGAVARGAEISRRLST